MILKESVIDNWGEALKKIAIETKMIDRFINESTVLIDLLKDRDDFIKVLIVKNPSFDKNKIIDQTFKNCGVNEYFVNTMKILAQNQTFGYARAIFKNMRKKLTSLQNVVYGVAWSAYPLKKEQILQMEKKMTKNFDREVRLVNKIDQKLIGGVQLVVANHIFDGSIKGKLDQLRYQTLNNNEK